MILIVYIGWNNTSVQTQLMHGANMNSTVHCYRKARDIHRHNSTTNCR